MFKKNYLLFFIIVMCCVLFFSNSIVISGNIIEYDCALENTDYNDIEERKKLVLSDAKYSNKITEYSNFKSSYFDNLTYNFGMNYKGSCGYIGIAMLLSYYDTYLSDDIIPEQYDINSYGESNNMITRRNSPGVLKDVVVDPIDTQDTSYGFKMSSYNYYSIMLSLQNTSLQAKLITIGANLGYFDFDDNDNPCGTNFSHRYNILNDYLSDIGYNLNKDYSIESYNGEASTSMSESVRKFAIQQVNNGKPVLLSVGGLLGGHVVVAYDYDESNDKLYCHMGWNASQTHTTIEENSFTWYKTALAINFKSSHKHSNNYAVTTYTSDKTVNNYYCYDDSNIVTYSKNHTHMYNAYYQSYSTQKHKAFCECGKYVLLAHSINSKTQRIINGHVYANCIDCNTLVDLGSTIVINPSALNKFKNINLLDI